MAADEIFQSLARRVDFARRCNEMKITPTQESSARIDLTSGENKIRRLRWRLEKENKIYA
jgi:hypothetical protein